MVFSQANENVFFLNLWEPFFGRVDASITINQHRHHHSIASFFSALRGPIKEVKKKTLKISLRIHPAYFQTARLTASATKKWICVVPVVAKAREIEEEEKNLMGQSLQTKIEWDFGRSVLHRSSQPQNIATEERAFSSIKVAHSGRLS